MFLDNAQLMSLREAVYSKLLYKIIALVSKSNYDIGYNKIASVIIFID
mgnify:CR=1 FL=1